MKNNMAHNQNNNRPIHAMGVLYFTMACIVLIFIRFLFAQQPFSFDYSSYILIIDSVSSLTYAEILGANLDLLYVKIHHSIPIEFGFVLIVKTISLFGYSPEETYAIIAALSVGLRIYTMRSLGLPVYWILWVNMIAITLFEANALRLGVASSVIIFGLRQLFLSRVHAGFLIIGAATIIHLQTVLFIFPFVMSYLFFCVVPYTKISAIILLISVSFATYFSFGLVSYVQNEKILDYAERGASVSAGLSVTSVLAVVMLMVALIAAKRHRMLYVDASFFISIVAASAPSIFALIFLTNVAVIGDRAWQLVFVILTVFCFTQWTDAKWRKLLLYIIIVLSCVMHLNVLIRYPLSDFFSPPYPQIYY
jgi:hypothetical protein